MPKKTYPNLVLAITPTARGFAFVLFEGPLAPHDWGLTEIRSKPKNTRTIERVRQIIERYHPHTLVIPDCASRSARRSPRIRALALALKHLALAQQMDVQQLDRATIRRCFVSVGARTKVEIAHAIAREIPAFKHRLPPVRKIWMSEDSRQWLFDAAALGLTHYASTGRPERDP